MQMYAIIQRDSTGFFVWFREDPKESSPHAIEVVETHKVPEEMSYEQVPDRIKDKIR